MGLAAVLSRLPDALGDALGDFRGCSINGVVFGEFLADDEVDVRGERNSADVVADAGLCCRVLRSFSLSQSR